MVLPTKKVSLACNRVASYTTFPAADKFDAQKPTLLLVHSFVTDVNLFTAQFADSNLQQACNLVAVDLIGHGGTTCYGSGGTGLDNKGWSFWDNARLCFDVLNKLGIPRAFVLGASQGGFVAVRMALIDSSRISGVLLCGTSIYAETAQTVAWGCWDAHSLMGDVRRMLATNKPDLTFRLPNELVDSLIRAGFGEKPEPESDTFWKGRVRDTYQGELGRRRFRGALTALLDRDTVEHRVKEVDVPVLIAHGTEDSVYSVEAARHMKDAFTGASVCELGVVDGGQHYLIASHPALVSEMVLRFIKNNAGKSTAKGLDKVGSPSGGSHIDLLKEKVKTAESGRKVLGGGDEPLGYAESAAPLAS